jgi:hypothetical protein
MTDSINQKTTDKREEIIEIFVVMDLFKIK